MHNEEVEMDDELALDESLDLIRVFFERYRSQIIKDGFEEPVPPPVVDERPVINGQLCFVITRNRSFSWAEDLSHFVRIEESKRVYN